FSLDEDGRFVNWLLSIARFTALRHRRRLATRRESPLLNWLDLHAIDGPAIDPEQVAIDRIEVGRMLARLSPPLREAVVLQYAADVPGDEIARRWGTSSVAIWKLTERTRRFLRRAYPERIPRSTSRSLPVAFCACGCGEELPARRSRRRRFASESCRHRHYRITTSTPKRRDLTASTVGGARVRADATIRRAA
ncbi:MAG TPA: sigma factor-like helix-turn-helix DNA-binding protein, partial [Candidatus Dormibacteraeota bacterium]|nr:sigma factor-like helix-turn-helix DNA-binding protein [Candidatus Dormibacteraeota bacterium]